MRKVWLSSIDYPKENVQKIIGILKTYGIAADGHFWEDNLEKFSWIKPRREILDKNIPLWIILTSANALQKPSIRYGLTMLTASIQAQRGIAFPILILQTDKNLINPDSLTTLLNGVDILSVENSVLGAKIVAKLHTPTKKRVSPYRLDVYGIEGIGQWFEIGPVAQTWKGAMFGVFGAQILLHAVGPSGQLPEKSTLQYPMQGLEVEVGEKKFITWAVQNELPPAHSYYIKVEGSPKTVLFSPFSQDDDTEAFIVNLQ